MCNACNVYTRRENSALKVLALSPSAELPSFLLTTPQLCHAFYITTERLASIAQRYTYNYRPRCRKSGRNAAVTSGRGGLLHRTFGFDSRRAAHKRMLAIGSVSLGGVRRLLRQAVRLVLGFCQFIECEPLSRKLDCGQQRAHGAVRIEQRCPTIDANGP